MTFDRMVERHIELRLSLILRTQDVADMLHHIDFMCAKWLPERNTDILFSCRFVLNGKIVLNITKSVHFIIYVK